MPATNTDPIALCPDGLAACFESLGDKCEFGIAQSLCGIEPLGLLRFASLPHAQLLDLLNTRFAALDDADAISVHLRDDHTEWWGCIAPCGIDYHTSRNAAQVSHAEALSGERMRIAFLKRKLLSDLERPAKIFVRRDPWCSPAEMAELFAALRRYGPHQLLWVDQSTDPAMFGTVQPMQPGFLHGFLGHFWPDASPSPDGLAIWLNLLAGAVALLRPDEWHSLHHLAAQSLAPADATLPALQWRCLSAAASEISRTIPPHTQSRPVFAHRLRANTTPEHGGVVCCAASGLRPGALYVASSWVWLPPDFTGWIGMVFPGLLWIKMWPADITRRACWQRIATSIRLPPTSTDADPTTTHYPALIAAGPAGTLFYSTNHRLHRGVA